MREQDKQKMAYFSNEYCLLMKLGDHLLESEDRELLADRCFCHSNDADLSSDTLF